jgi:hypothetical protein
MPQPDSTTDLLRTLVEKRVGFTVTRTRLLDALRKLGCESLEFRRSKCDFWKTPSGISFPVMDGEFVSSDGEILYDLDYARDLITHVLGLSSSAPPEAVPAFKAPSFNLNRRRTGSPDEPK